MLMVIFGAGASYDSMPSRPAAGRRHPLEDQTRPPLASELFENRGIFAAALGEFPECRAIVPWLRKPRGTLESELQRLQDEEQNYPARHSQLAAVRYYLQLMLWRCEQGWKNLAMGITNYASLLDMVEQWRQSHDESACFVTFNYDTLLEDALQVVGMGINTISDYITADPRYFVIKLHGSVTWFREVVSPTDFRMQEGEHGIRQQLIRRAAQLAVGNRYVQGNPGTIAILEGKIVFPAIAIPVERKSQFECPADHLEALRSRLPKVRKVLIVGWRAMEEHFLSLLNEHLQAPLEVMVVEGSNKGASEVEGRLKRVLGSRVTGKIQSVSGGFTEFVESRRVIPFLESELAQAPRLPVVG
jgi:hypothetical protein